MDLLEIFNYRIKENAYLNQTGFVFTEVREGYAKGEAEVTESLMNPIGSVHGGVYFTIADSVGGMAASSRGRYVTTVNATIHYLRPGINCKKLVAETREIKTGKEIAVYDVTISTETGRVLAEAMLTYKFMGLYEDLLKKMGEEPDRTNRLPGEAKTASETKEA